MIVRLRATVWHVLAAALAVMFALLGASPSAAATHASTYDSPSYVYDAPALLSSQSAAASYVRGSPSGPEAVPWASPVFVARGVVAANTAKSVPFELKSLGNSVYESPAGLIYGPGSKHGHRLTHVLQHSIADPTKKAHSVFSSGNGALKTVDEAWTLRGAPEVGDPGAFVVQMGRQVGTAGETGVRIIVKPGTSEVISAYPWAVQ
ncbi:hypothetical protein [Cellulomonas palmilytica]|uniref:hypothetical protein n=1 Tax=Cellulomonas palmilytica TaxID=2608402 RepID=UPI001F3CD40C|nr:hypothetical protein [Cellulomonas palmilytica]